MNNINEQPYPNVPDSRNRGSFGNYRNLDAAVNKKNFLSYPYREESSSSSSKICKKIPDD